VQPCSLDARCHEICRIVSVSNLVTYFISNNYRPYWLHCGNDNGQFGIFDPPGAVPPVDGLFPSSPSPATATTTSTTPITTHSVITSPGPAVSPVCRLNSFRFLSYQSQPAYETMLTLLDHSSSNVITNSHCRSRTFGFLQRCSSAPSSSFKSCSSGLLAVYPSPTNSSSTKSNTVTNTHCCRRN
jgi:hypothetical protein